MGSFPSASPIKVATSKPWWMLAADVVAKPSGSWSFPTTPGSGWSTLPAHKEGNQAFPAGGNEVFIDGSVQWVKARQMVFIHSWNLALPLYFYQDDLGVLERSRLSLNRVQ